MYDYSDFQGSRFQVNPTPPLLLQDITFVRDHLPFHTLFDDTRVERAMPLPLELAYDENAVILLLQRGHSIDWIAGRMQTSHFRRDYDERGSVWHWTTTAESDDILRFFLGNCKIMEAALCVPPPLSKRLHCLDFWIEISEGLLRDATIWDQPRLVFDLLRQDIRTWKYLPAKLQTDSRFLSEYADIDFLGAASISGLNELMPGDDVINTILEESVKKKRFPDDTPQAKAHWGHLHFFWLKMKTAVEILRRFPTKFLELPEELRHYREFVDAASTKAPLELEMALQKYRVSKKEEREWRQRYILENRSESQYVDDAYKRTNTFARRLIF